VRFFGQHQPKELFDVPVSDDVIAVILLFEDLGFSCQFFRMEVMVDVQIRAGRQQDDNSQQNENFFQLNLLTLFFIKIAFILMFVNRF